MNSKLIAFFLLLSLAACGESFCQQTCDQARPQLVRDFSVPESQVVCSDRKWAQATTCEACETIFRNDYGVSALDCAANPPKQLLNR